MAAPLGRNYDPAMTISFEDARRIAAAILSEHWGYAVMMEPHGCEDEQDFRVIVRSDVEQLGGPVVLVEKADGTVHLIPYFADPNRWETMAPVVTSF